MTREEAIHELQEDKRLYETEVCHAGDGSPDGRLLEAIDMAIEALSADTVPIEKYHELQHQFVMLGATFADLTSVVRCKDCKNWRESHSEDEEPYCYIDGRTTDSTDYCSWGEKRGPSK